MKTLKVVAQARDSRGSGPMGRLRRTGVIPAVVYGDGKQSRLIQLVAHDFEQLIRGHTGEHQVMDLEIGGEKELKVLLKEIQHHPVSGRIIHADFNEISMTKKLRIEIPIKLVGEPVGVKDQGGVLQHICRSLVVECLPTDILENVPVDVSGLHISEHLLVSGIQMDPARYTILTAPEQAIAAVAAPKIEEEPVAAEAVAATAEPEVLREKKVEGEEGEAAEGEAEGKKEGKGEGKKEAKAEGKKEGKGDEKKEAAKPKPEAKAEGKKSK